MYIITMMGAYFGKYKPIYLDPEKKDIEVLRTDYANIATKFHSKISAQNKIKELKKDPEVKRMNYKFRIKELKGTLSGCKRSVKGVNPIYLSLHQLSTQLQYILNQYLYYENNKKPVKPMSLVLWDRYNESSSSEYYTPDWGISVSFGREKRHGKTMKYLFKNLPIASYVKKTEMSSEEYVAVMTKLMKDYTKKLIEKGYKFFYNNKDERNKDIQNQVKEYFKLKIKLVGLDKN